MNQNRFKMNPLQSNDQSMHSLIFSGDKINLNEDSLESNSSGLFDIKKTLKNKLKRFAERKEEINKELEMHQIIKTDQDLNEDIKIEIIHNRADSVGEENLNQKSQRSEKSKLSSEQKEQEQSYVINQIAQRIQDTDFVNERDEENKGSSQMSPYSPITPEGKIEDAEREIDLNKTPQKVIVKSVPNELIPQTESTEEIKEKSKRVEEYLKKEQVSSNEIDAIPSEIEVLRFDPDGKVVYEEENLGKQTPEGVLDKNFSNLFKSDTKQPKEEACETPKNQKDIKEESKSPSESETEKDEVPVISYSEDEQI